MRAVPIDYREELRVANEVPLHFLTAFHRLLERQLELSIPVRAAKGDLHLNVAETHRPLIPGNYWVLVAGGKQQIQTKIWSFQHAQRLVDLLTQEGLQVVQAGARFPGHIHAALRGVRNLVGRTTLRQFIQLLLHADGVICPVTAAMHIAAVFDKPCVVLAGGREPRWWEAYLNAPLRHFGPDCLPVRTPHRFLHTLGALGCCMDGGCWKTNLPHGNVRSSRDCVDSVDDGAGQSIPRCLATLSPEYVAAEVFQYIRRADSLHG